MIGLFFLEILLKQKKRNQASTNPELIRGRSPVGPDAREGCRDGCWRLFFAPKIRVLGHPVAPGPGPSVGTAGEPRRGRRRRSRVVINED